MDPISNVDRILLVLRQQLSERAKAKRRSLATGKVPPRSASPARSIAALVVIEGIDDRQMRRALIQSLLVDQFGEALINDAQFQNVVGQVSDAIEEDDGARQLIDHVVAELRRR